MRFALAALLLIVPLSVSAAVVPVTLIPVSLDVVPAYPAPNTTVNISAVSRADEGVYTYVWKKDGVEIARGIDVTSVIVNAGGAGSETEISVSLENESGGEAGYTTYVLRPASVDLIWEGDTYVPPLYQGKRYANGDSVIILQAIPSFYDVDGAVSAQRLLYEWDADGKKVASGYGRSSVRINPTQFKRATTVTLTVSTPDGATAARATAVVPIVSPVLRFYEERPLAGAWFSRAVYGTTPFSGDEMTFRAVPFFVSNPDALNYSWTLAGAAVSAPGDKPQMATFRKTSEGTGEFPVGLTIQKPGSIFERAAEAFNLSFN